MQNEAESQHRPVPHATSELGDLLGAASAGRAGEGGPGGSSFPQPIRETLQPLAPAHDCARGRLYRGMHTRRMTGHRVPPEPEPTASLPEPKYRVRRNDGAESEGNARAGALDFF